MYIERKISKIILESSLKMPVITISGPRQSGKTTLAKAIFKDYSYYNMELPLLRERFLTDPLSFFIKNDKGFIIDEFQNLPEILSYIQSLSDEDPKPGRYILTGSQNFILLEKISQSLAGRTSLFYLLPFSCEELYGTKYQLFESEEYIYKGFYPRIYNSELNPTEWLNDYINLYLERDIRKIINIRDLAPFSLFLKLCAGRIGQILNISALSDIVGKDAKTIRAWLSALEAGFVVYLLKPYYKNFNKRITKSPKLYFYDTGLACALLGIKHKEELSLHYLKGQLFENFIISEIIKYQLNYRQNFDIYFWNEQGNNEIDLIIESSGKITGIEIKASDSFTRSFIKNLLRFRDLIGSNFQKGFIVMNTKEEYQVNDINIINWRMLDKIVKSEK